MPRTTRPPVRTPVLRVSGFTEDVGRSVSPGPALLRSDVGVSTPDTVEPPPGHGRRVVMTLCDVSPVGRIDRGVRSVPGGSGTHRTVDGGSPGRESRPRYSYTDVLRSLGTSVGFRGPETVPLLS